MNRLLILFFLWIFSSFSCLAQGTLIGQVSDEAGPLSFVHVGIQGQKIGTFSNDQGQFILDKLPEGAHTLLSSFVGYRSSEIPVVVQSGKETFISIKLEKSFSELE